jgi:hypothetical protein
VTADIYANGRIPPAIRLLAFERLHGGPNLATRKGLTREHKREALLLALECNRHLFVWKGEAKIVWGIYKDALIDERQVKVPLNIHTRKPRSKTK